MDIQNINISGFVQSFEVSDEDKLEYGEIYSPFSLIESMLDMFDKEVFSEKDARWLDPGAGTGYFSMCLFSRLNAGLEKVITNDEERHKHIVGNMIYMVEIKHSNVVALKKMFGDDANIVHSDFLSTDMSLSFDYVIGNPPYNSHEIGRAHV